MAIWRPTKPTRKQRKPMRVSEADTSGKQMVSKQKHVKPSVSATKQNAM